MSYKIVVALMSFVVAGCASICNWEAHQTIRVHADEENVLVTVCNAGERVDQFFAPHEIQLKSSRYGFCPSRYEFVFTKDGYQTERRYRDGRFCGWYLGNILFGGLIGMIIVDPLTGSMYKIDGYPIEVHMRKKSECEETSIPVTVSNFSILSMNYDEKSHKGIIKVSYLPEQYEGARKFVRRSIENIAKDKNVALKTGEAPETATYYIGREEVMQPGVLEVEFEVE